MDGPLISGHGRRNAFAEVPGLEPSARTHFFQGLNQSVDAAFDRLPYLPAAMATMNSGENMVEWCEDGIVSLVSSGSYGGIDA
jgi:hypothetical protein